MSSRSMPVAVALLSIFAACSDKQGGPVASGTSFSFANSDNSKIEHANVGPNATVTTPDKGHAHCAEFHLKDNNKTPARQDHFNYWLDVRGNGRTIYVERRCDNQNFSAIMQEIGAPGVTVPQEVAAKVSANCAAGDADHPAVGTPVVFTMK